MKDTKIAAASELALSWESAHSDLAEKIALKWSVEEMSQWGSTENPYPPSIIKLAYTMMLNGAKCQNISGYMQVLLAAFCGPDSSKICVPSATTLKKWRPGLLALSDVVAGLKLHHSKHVTLHQDATSDNQRKFACLVLDTDQGLVLANGVFTQANGSAKEGANMMWASLSAVQATMESFAQLLLDKGCTHTDSSLLPEKFNLLRMLVDGSKTMANMQDHATVQTAANVEFDKIRAEYAAAQYLPAPEKILTAGCGDHKRDNFVKAIRKAINDWLEQKLGGQEHNEFG